MTVARRRDDYCRQHPERIWGTDLRYLLTDLISSRPEQVWQVKDLVAQLRAWGFDLPERASKVVSDHLRTEVSRGRVRRVGWGAYRAGGHVPGSTRRRIRKRAQMRLDWLAAARAEAARAELAALLGVRT